MSVDGSSEGADWDGDSSSDSRPRSRSKDMAEIGKMPIKSDAVAAPSVEDPREEPCAKSKAMMVAAPRSTTQHDYDRHRSREKRPRRRDRSCGYRHGDLKKGDGDREEKSGGWDGDREEKHRGCGYRHPPKGDGDREENSRDCRKRHRTKGDGDRKEKKPRLRESPQRPAEKQPGSRGRIT